MGAGMDGTWITTSTPEWLGNAGCTISHQLFGDAKLARLETPIYITWMSWWIQERADSMAETLGEKVLHASVTIRETLLFTRLTTPPKLDAWIRHMTRKRKKSSQWQQRINNTKEG